MRGPLKAVPPAPQNRLPEAFAAAALLVRCPEMDAAGQGEVVVHSLCADPGRREPARSEGPGRSRPGSARKGRPGVRACPWALLVGGGRLHPRRDPGVPGPSPPGPQLRAAGTAGTGSTSLKQRPGTLDRPRPRREPGGEHQRQSSATPLPRSTSAPDLGCWTRRAGRDDERPSTGPARRRPVSRGGCRSGVSPERS